MKLAHPELFNIELGEKVLTHVITHPTQHNQYFEYQECAQVGCIMGWAAVFSGKRNGDSSWGDLHITEEEWEDIFEEKSNPVAIAKLIDYIAQAKVAQYVKNDVVLDNHPHAEQMELVLA